MRKSTRYIWQIHDLCICLFCILHGLIGYARIVFYAENNQIRLVNHGPISDLMGGLEVLFCGFETDFNFIIILMKCGASILHHIGGLHKIWDGLSKLETVCI